MGIQTSDRTKILKSTEKNEAVRGSVTISTATVKERELRKTDWEKETAEKSVETYCEPLHHQYIQVQVRSRQRYTAHDSIFVTILVVRASVFFNR